MLRFLSARYAGAVAQRLILTPDRRLRVFVSSTLRELALERVVAREAISSLRLAPILFEQGLECRPLVASRSTATRCLTVLPRARILRGS